MVFPFEVIHAKAQKVKKDFSTANNFIEIHFDPKNPFACVDEVAFDLPIENVFLHFDTFHFFVLLNVNVLSLCVFCLFGFPFVSVQLLQLQKEHQQNLHVHCSESIHKVIPQMSNKFVFWFHVFVLD